MFQTIQSAWKARRGLAGGGATAKKGVVLLLLGGLLWPGAARAQFTYTTNVYGNLVVAGYTGTAKVITMPRQAGWRYVTDIGTRAFQYNTNLTGVTIPDGFYSIGAGAFDSCSSLTNVTIPNSVTNIGGLAFWNCSSLTSIIIPSGVANIGNSTFRGCSNLNNITIPDHVTSIGGGAFWGCSSLTNIIIPGNVASIGTNAFADCGLTHVYFRGNAPMAVPSGSTFFSGTPATLYYYAETTGWTNPYSERPTTTYTRTELVQNGGFETGDFTGWTLSDPFLYLYSSFIHSGAYAAPLYFTSPTNLVFLMQTVPTTPGSSYVLSFWLANNSPPVYKFQVLWNGQTLLDQTNLPAFGWTRYQFTVTATGSNSQLQFSGSRTNSQDFHSVVLDDVSVVPISLLPVPTIQPPSSPGGNLALSWASLAGYVYYVESSTNLSSTNWTMVSPRQIATQTNINITLPAGNPRAFYRVALEP